MKKKVLFIDRDGTIIKEPPITFQVDTLEQLEFLPGVIRNLYKISHELDYELVMVTNQDGLGTASYPEENFNRVQSKLMEILSGEGIVFKQVLLDRSYPHENKDTRKPGIGMLTEYLKGDYDIENAYVIGDRTTDIQLAMNMGCKSIFIRNFEEPAEYEKNVSLIVLGWDAVYTFLKASARTAIYKRTTSETDIDIEINLDGTGKYNVSTGLNFFNHMLEQLAKHSNIDLTLNVKGDLHIDEHHTIEDTGIALGETLLKALSNKRGIERYGFCLPMDDCLAQVAIDFGGRPWLVWDAEFKREYVGDMPTEMFYHFFKSFSDAAKCTLNIKAGGVNEHHKIEAIFKAFARAIKIAVRKDYADTNIPTTKGLI